MATCVASASECASAGRHVASRDLPLRSASFRRSASDAGFGLKASHCVHLHDQVSTAARSRPRCMFLCQLATSSSLLLGTPTMPYRQARMTAIIKTNLKRNCVSLRKLRSRRSTRTYFLTASSVVHHARDSAAGDLQLQIVRLNTKYQSIIVHRHNGADDAAAWSPRFDRSAAP